MAITMEMDVVGAWATEFKPVARVQSNGVLPIYGLAPSGLLQAEGAGALFLKVNKPKQSSTNHLLVVSREFHP